MIFNICLVIVIILTLVMILGYNRFIKANNAVKESTSAIDVLLKQRFDLLPNIIECVKGYAKHEKTTLEELVKLRNSYNSNGFSVSEAEKIDKKFVAIMALAENYPELKANEQYLSLQNNLVDVITSGGYSLASPGSLVDNDCVKVSPGPLRTAPSEGVPEYAKSIQSKVFNALELDQLKNTFSLCFQSYSGACSFGTG